MRRKSQIAWLLLALIVSSAGLTACAKYPVVTDVRTSSPSAPAPVPTR